MSARKKTKPQAASDRQEPENGSKLSFEEALQRLETIVSRLEEGDVPLEESLAAYAEGTRLARTCRERLERAEVMIKKLSEDAEGFRLDSTSVGTDEGTEEVERKEHPDGEADGRDELF